MCPRERRKRIGAVGGVEFGQRIEGRREARDEFAGAVAILFPESLRSPMHELIAGSSVPFGVIECGSDAFEAASEIRRTKDADLEGARVTANVKGLEADPAERVTQQRHRFCRSEIADDSVDNKRQEGAWHGLGERSPGAVVDANAPGFEPDRDAPRQQPVGRDERRRAPRHLDRLAQDQRHDFGFILRRRSFDERDARQPAFEFCVIGFCRETDANAPFRRPVAWLR